MNCFEAYRKWAGDDAADILKYASPEFKAGLKAAIKEVLRKLKKDHEG